ncbi:MAG TPA: TonB-dependent receptor [Gallionellaceae bacterium]
MTYVIQLRILAYSYLAMQQQFTGGVISLKMSKKIPGLQCVRQSKSPVHRQRYVLKPAQTPIMPSTSALSPSSVSLAATILLIQSLRAYAADTAPEQEILQDFPVVLSASRLAQPISEAPNAMTVIDRDMIKSSGFRTISDLFRLVPGMYVGTQDGHSPIVSYHGATDQYSRRMQVLVDGRSVYLPPFSSVDWEDIPLQIDDIERIEVVRGPAAASHGANSLQGVINIITRDAGSLNGMSISANSGERGINDVEAHMGKAGETLDYRLTMAYKSDDGYGTSVLNDHSTTRMLNLRTNYHPNGADSIDLQLGYSGGVRGLGIQGRPDTDPYRDTFTTNAFQQVKWQHVLDSGDDVSVQYYHIYRDSSDSAPPGNTLAERHEAELQHTLQIGDKNRLVWGGGARYDKTDSPMNVLIPYSQYQTHFFVHDEWRATGSTVLNAGAMYEEDGMGHHNTSPRLALNYHLTPQHTLRASSSVAYRSPAIMEENANSSLLGTPPAWYSLGGLRPEKVLSREVGYLGEFVPMNLSVDARLYSDQISDIIYVDPISWRNFPPLFLPYSQFGFANLMDANLRGFETTVKYRWAERNSLILNYSRQMMSCAVTGTLTLQPLTPMLQDIADSCTASVPWNSGSVLLTQQVLDNYLFSAGFYYQSEMQIIQTMAPESRMQRLDLRLARTFGDSPKPGSGEIAFVVQNVLQDNYTIYSAVPQTTNITFNRRAYIFASLNF